MIDNDSKQLGIKSVYEALRLAEEKDLDLVEVGPNSNPPVARIMDFGKYQYEQEKKIKQQSRSATDVKEIRLTVNIDKHDWDVKLERAKKFIAKSGRLKVDMVLSGRQMLFTDRAMDKLNKFREELNGEYEERPQRFGRRYTVIIKLKAKDEEAETKNTKDAQKKN